MRALRQAAILALALGAALAARAAERTGPEPSEVIRPRSEISPAAAPGADASAVAALAPAGRPAGLLPAAGYVLALGLLAGGSWFLLKRGSLRRPFARNDGRLNVLETRMLGNRQFLVVVEYDDAKMLLGVCPGRIDYLTPLAGHPLAAAQGGEDEAAVPAFGAVVDGGRR